MEGGLEAGCDEAGRGCLAGPVFAAAVVLPPAADFPGLRDSKKLSETERDILRHRIEREALAWAVGRVEPEEIDTINILQASFLAMHRALDQLGETPDRILVDGNRFVPYREVPHHTFVKGDDRYLSIAAASILAKTHRDACMAELDGSFPHYGWLRNKGYPTVTHRRAIREHGPCCHHRKSFRLLPVGEAHE
jgi:ribonuclease HII